MELTILVVPLTYQPAARITRDGGKMKTVKTIINGKVTEVPVRDFNGMYQIISGAYACGIVRKDEVL